MSNAILLWKCDWCGGTLREFNGVIACEDCRATNGKEGTSFNDGFVETRQLKGEES